MSKGLFVRVLALSVLLCGLFSFSRTARADNVYASIRGNVTDSTGAAVAGAKVTATNTATGVSVTVTSKADGSYEILQLAAPGTYDVSAEQTGFKAFGAQGIPLQLNQIFVQNVTLEVGAVTQKVTVEAAPAQVETTSMQLGGEINSTSVTELPLNGRNWVQLQQTLPGVVSSSDRFGSNYSTNGARTQSNGYLINGTDANDLPLNTPLQIPSPDAIGEVNVVTNTINPEYGRNSGAVLNAVTKSGTNAFHGDGFEFYRDNALNTRNFFSPTKTVFHQNQFGGTIGGPIKKDKAFFFFSYQGTRFREPSVNGGNQTTVFTKAQRDGSFPDIATNTTKGTGLPLLSPLPLTGDNGTVFPAGTPYSTIFSQGTIPTVDINPVANNLLTKFVPLPNSPDGIDFLFSPITTGSTNQEISRIDDNIGDHNSIFGYGYWSRSPSVDGTPFTGATLPGFAETGKRNVYQYTLAWNHTFSGTTLNEVRLGYNRFNFVAVSPQTPVLPSSVGFTGITPQSPAVAGIPFIGVTGFFSLGFSVNGPQPRIDQTYQVTDNFTKVVGGHTFKMGFNMLRAEVFNPFSFVNNGDFGFGGAGAFSTGDPGADFLLGIPDSYAQSSGNVINARAQQYYSYFQDQWKVRKNLTLTYGTAWQIDTPLTDTYNGGLAINCFRPGQQSTVFPTAPAGLVFPGDANCTESGYHTHYDHFGPRVGFAYGLGSSGKTSIRGGFGVYYNVPEEELTLQNLLAPPFAIISGGAADFSESPSFAAPYTAITGQVNPNKFPFTPAAKGSTPNFPFFEPFSLNTLDPNFTTPSSYNYNLTIQRELPGSMIASIGYVGLQGRHLENTTELNPAGQFPGVNPAAVAAGCNPGNLFFCAPQTFAFPQTIPGSTALIYGSIGQQTTNANSNYNALQIEVNKHFTRGLQFDANYTWSHSLDVGSSFENSQGLQNPFALFTSYGDSAFDARNRFVISYIYDLPDIRHNQGGLSRLTGGWEITGITTLQGGFPIELFDSSANSLTCDAIFTFYGCWDRPNTIGSVEISNPRNNSLTYTAKNASPRSNYYFNPNSFAVETLGAVGDTGRNFFHGPGINNFDFSLLKDIHITESKYLQLRFEFFNFFNHADFDFTAANANVNSRNFGRVTSLDGLGASQYPAASRLIQLGAKFIF